MRLEAIINWAGKNGRVYWSGHMPVGCSFMNNIPLSQAPGKAWASENLSPLNSKLLAKARIMCHVHLRVGLKFYYETQEAYPSGITLEKSPPPSTCR